MAITTRNLLYHVCPLAANDVWRQNVRQLLRRIDLFNGRRVIAIATGGNLESAGAVETLFADRGCQLLHVTNDPQLREVVTFLPLLEAIADADPNQATFYAHTKGNSTAVNMEGARRWRNLMYHALLDRWPECLADLSQDNIALVGTHFMHWQPRRSPFPTRLDNRYHWIFAGTFFWFRHDRVFASPHWREVPRDRYGAEAWPGQMFPPADGVCVWPADGRNLAGVNPYDPQLYAAEEIPDDA
jgi:hypothetical protein